MQLSERTKRGGMAVLALASVVAGVGLIIFSTMEKNDKDALDARGIEVPAEVLDVSVKDGGEDGPTSVVTVRFKPRGDNTERTTNDVSYSDDFDDDFPSARSAGVRVEYDPRDPELARIPGEDSSIGWIMGYLSAAIALAFGIGLGIHTVRRLRESELEPMSPDVRRGLDISSEPLGSRNRGRR